MAITTYRDLVVWQKAMDLVVHVYKLTSVFPRDELYGLTAQLRKSAISVPSNISEGQGRKSTAEFMHHLSIALGSLCEVETQLLVAGRLEYVEGAPLDTIIEQCAEVGRLLNGLYNSLSPKLA